MSVLVFYAKTKHTEWTGGISQSQTVGFHVEKNFKTLNISHRLDVVKNFQTLNISHRLDICGTDRTHQASCIKAFMVEIWILSYSELWFSTWKYSDPLNFVYTTHMHVYFTKCFLTVSFHSTTNKKIWNSTKHKD